MPTIRSAYDAHERQSIDYSEEEKKTKQEAAAECDINNIMARYEKTGLIDHVNQHKGEYGDYTNVQDFQTSVEQISKAQEMFLSIPAAIRSRFDNSPALFLEFVSDPENEHEMREIGLLPAEAGKSAIPSSDDPPPSKTAHAKPDPDPEPSTKPEKGAN